LRRTLFPALPQAYEHWLADRNTAALLQTVTAAQSHWLDTARHLTSLYRRDPLQGDAALNALAGGDLVTLKR
jgi:hypothetical protein